MNDFTFLHTADIHLDSPLRGLERYDGAPVEEIRNATRVAFTNLIDLALEKAVDFVVIAGDIYDGDWRDYNSGLFFTKEMGRLRKAEIPAYILAGNHDAANVITKQIQLPDNVHHFSYKAPESFQIEKLGVALHGQSFKTRAIEENLSLTYPPAQTGFFNIGVLHTSATGRPGHDTYAPCSISDLVSKEYDYWALGHVHNREILDENPWIVFPGNPQGRHIREQGPKSCTLVTVSDREIVSVESHEIDVLRWAEIAIDCSDIADYIDLRSAVADALTQEVETADGRTLAARLVLTGACAIHPEITRNREQTIGEIRGAAVDYFHESVWIEQVIFNTSPIASPKQDLKDGTPAADLLELLDLIAGDDQEISALTDELNDLKRKVPQSLITNGDDPELFASEWIRARIHEIKDEIFPLLLQETD